MVVPRELSREECLSRLPSEGVGRLAIAGSDGAHIFPVNYVVHRDSIVFRTAAYSELGQHPWASSAVVAFEIDHLDDASRSGWSVVVRGQPQRIEDEAELETIAWTNDPSPWAGGLRRQYVRVPFSEVTGRVVGEDRQPLDG